MAKHDLVVLGAGPGGYTAAIRAAQLGLDVACVEREPALGGTCLRVGCIPSKALLESSEKFHEAKDGLRRFGVIVSGVELDLPAMLEKKDDIVRTLTQGVAGLLKKNKIRRYAGHASFLAPDRVQIEGDDVVEVEAKNVLIATGSNVAALPGVPFDGDRIGTSTEALAYPTVPEHLVVIGAGYIGLELGSVWQRLGARVTALEYLDRILPGMDSEIAREAERVFRRQGLELRLGSRVTSASVEGQTVTVHVDGAEPITCDRLLVAVGRVPNTDGLGLERIGVELDGRGRIQVGPHFATNVKGVYAVGDVIAGPMLAHKAEEEGVACVEHLVTGYGHVNYDAIPGIVYTHPEIATVGKSEDELREANIPYRKGLFPFAANGRARALGMPEGRVKVLAHEQTDRILGVHIIGPRAGDLIAEAAVAMEFGASSEDLARVCHAHPTLAEAVKEAALGVDGRSVNI